MKIDMLLSSMSMGNQQSLKGVKGAESNKTFADLFTQKLSESNQSQEATATTSSSNTSVEQRQQTNKDSKVSKEIATVEKENSPLKDEEITEVEALIQQLNLILIQVQEENVSLEDGLEEINEILATVDLSLMENQLKESNDGLKQILLEMESLVQDLDLDLETIKDIAPLLDKFLLQDEVKEILTTPIVKESIDETKLLPQQEILPQTTGSLQGEGLPEGFIESYEGIIETEINLQQKESMKNEKNIDNNDNISIEEGSEPSPLTGEIPVDGSKQFQQVIQQLVDDESINVDPKVLIEEVANKAKILTQNGKSEMKIQLMPENLGSLHINITVEKGNVTAKMYAENQQIKELIDANLDQLRIALGDKGISITKLEVAVGHNQQDFSGAKSFHQQKGKMKLKRVNKAEINNGLHSMEYLQEASTTNPYLVTSKINGLA
ncbi:flagellar hook-length control protein FliK [Alkaliphilus transvaalensis]|uniref:flagellar hook-length control protein FliK n=1 Tax=Alkaliphilus transvaalensis TaxID=114628 RepID=UPI000479BC09|nr:flagellar hook-length control protein FliK [Alkaliphilus transvaalensis]